MKNKYGCRLFSLFILFILFSFQSRSQLIDSHYLGKLKYGMSLIDVSNLDIQFSNITGEGQENGTAKIQIVTVDVYDGATLYLKHEKIDHVGITFSWCNCRPYLPDAVSPLLSEDCKRTLSKVENYLTSIYGKPKINSNFGVNKTWLSSTSKIELVVNDAMINLFFSKRK